MRLLHATVVEEPFSITYRKCVDLAAGRILPLHAHHAHLHFGRAGEAQLRAGHLTVPLAPFLPLPIHNCADLAEFFPPTPR